MVIFYALLVSLDRDRASVANLSGHAVALKQ